MKSYHWIIFICVAATPQYEQDMQTGPACSGVKSAAGGYTLPPIVSETQSISERLLLLLSQSIIPKTQSI